jgi:hypothetical protein
MDKLKPKTFYEYIVGDKQNWLFLVFLVIFGFTPGVLAIIYTEGYRWFWFLLSSSILIIWFYGEYRSFKKYIKVLEK